MLIGPTKTPLPVKVLLWAIAAVSLLSPPLTYFLHQVLRLPGPQDLFPLTLAGFKLGFFFQLVSYSFIHSIGVAISFSLFITLFFHLLLLWFSGSEICFRFGSKRFFVLYFGATIIAGLAAVGIMALTATPSVLVGSSPPLYALIAVWCMLYPELQLAFLFFLRMRAKWLVVVLLGFSLLMSLVYGAYANFVADVTGILIGYLFGTIAFNLQSPFAATYRFDRWLNSLSFRRR